MAESTPPSDSAPSGGGNKLTKFIKKNKTLSAVIGVVGGYIAYKQLNKDGTEPVEAVEVEEPARGSGPIEAAEVSHEAIDSEIARIDEENRIRDEELKRFEEEQQNKGEGGGGGETEPGGGDTEPTTPEAAPNLVVGGGGVSLHGKEFQGATSSRIARTGQTSGGKKFIEYVISFPGRQEHWQYFTATGNWRMSNDSSTGAGQNKPPRAQPPGQGGGVSGGSPGQKQRPVADVAPAKPVATPSSGEHDKAQKEINRLQGEVDGLQNHINQLTNAIQQNPKAQKRGQWENERNADRANIDHKRNEITYWRARL